MKLLLLLVLILIHACVTNPPSPQLRHELSVCLKEGTEKAAITTNDTIDPYPKLDTCFEVEILTTEEIKVSFYDYMYCSCSLKFSTEIDKDTLIVFREIVGEISLCICPRQISLFLTSLPDSVTYLKYFNHSYTRK